MSPYPRNSESECSELVFALRTFAVVLERSVGFLFEPAPFGRKGRGILGVGWVTCDCGDDLSFESRE